MAHASFMSAVNAAAQSHLERPQERRADRVVVRVGDAVASRGGGRDLHDRHELIEPVETFHRSRQHLHQLLPLLAHVAAKHPLERRVEFESLW